MHVWSVGRSWSTQRESMQAQGEHENSTQKGSTQLVDSNPGPSSVRQQCKPLYHHTAIFLSKTTSDTCLHPVHPVSILFFTSGVHWKADPRLLTQIASLPLPHASSPFYVFLSHTHFLSRFYQLSSLSSPVHTSTSPDASVSYSHSKL